MRSSRLTWDEYFLKIVETVAERATCDRGRSGALLVSQRQILATGYVGSPPGFPHCDDVGHLLEEGPGDEVHCVRTVHAEQNALASAARAGIPILGSTLYCTMAPCRVCAMLIVTAGVHRVISAHPYQSDAGLKVLSASGISYVVRGPEQLYNPAPSLFHLSYVRDGAPVTCRCSLQRDHDVEESISAPR